MKKTNLAGGILLLALLAPTNAQVPGMFNPLQGTLPCPAAPTTSLWGQWYVDGGAYTETVGTPTTLITTNGTSIGSLRDQSGNSRHAYQPVGGLKPVYTTGQINNLAAAVFTAASLQFLQVGSIPSLPVTIYVVANRTSSAAPRPYIAAEQGNPLIFVGTLSNNTNVAVYNAGAGASQNNSNSVWNVVAATVGSGAPSATTLRSNNTITASANATGGAIGSTVLQFGANVGNSYYFAGSEAEILIYSATHTFTSGDGLLVEQYLSCKYGLNLGY